MNLGEVSKKKNKTRIEVFISFFIIYIFNVVFSSFPLFVTRVFIRTIAPSITLFIIENLVLASKKKDLSIYI